MAERSLREVYLRREKSIRNYRADLCSMYEHGVEKGIEKVAVNMLQNKFLLEQIQQCTALSQAQIEQLAKENS